MEIKKTPQNYASLRRPLLYTVTDTAPRTFDVQIIDGDSDEVVGVKRLTGVTEGVVDASPFLRHRLFFKPATGPSGFITAAGRIVVGTIRVGGLNSARQIFVPTDPVPTPPALLTTFGSSRRIGLGECAELTLWTETPCQIKLTPRKGGTSGTPRNYTAPHAGFTLFRLNTADFPESNAIDLSIAGIGSVSYYYTAFISGHRLAWCSSAGSVEHYTFPIEKERTEDIQKEQVLTEKGYQPVTIHNRKVMTLLSAYEPQEVLSPLTEILSSSKVWSIDNGVYTPVEVINAASGIRSHGTLRNLEVQVAYQPQLLLP